VASLANAAAHEINNPLAVIAGHLAILEKRLTGSPEFGRRLEKMSKACRRISEMIEHRGRVTRLELYQLSPGLPPTLDLRRSSAAPPTEGENPEPLE
jgi:signal transduction histidine kinase